MQHAKASIEKVKYPVANAPPLSLGGMPEALASLQLI